jgi:hypothetical protein
MASKTALTAPKSGPKSLLGKSLFELTVHSLPAGKG